jgi:hypothetical protein
MDELRSVFAVVEHFRSRYPGVTASWAVRAAIADCVQVHGLGPAFTERLIQEAEKAAADPAEAVYRDFLRPTTIH